MYCYLATELCLGLLYRTFLRVLIDCSTILQNKKVYIQGKHSVFGWRHIEFYKPLEYCPTERSTLLIPVTFTNSTVLQYAEESVVSETSMAFPKYQP
jgi:hypothetical protein